MIKKIEKLPGLPGGQGVEIKPYSAEGRGTFREGVVVQLTDHQDRAWIGNFQPSGGAGTHLFASGLAAVLAGPHCYLIADEKSEPRIISSPGRGSVWSEIKAFNQKGKPYLLLIGSGGCLVCIDDAGSVVGKVHLDEPCEEVRLETLETDSVKGSFYEFNLKKRVPFSFRLPALTDV